MRVEDVRKQTTKELEQELAKAESDLAEFMLDIHTKDVGDVRRGKKLRKHIAQIKTIIRERELMS